MDKTNFRKSVILLLFTLSGFMFLTESLPALAQSVSRESPTLIPTAITGTVPALAPIAAIPPTSLLDLKEEALHQVNLSEEQLRPCESRFEIGEVKVEGEWAYITVVCWPLEQHDPSVFVPTITLFAVAHLEGNNWQVFLEGSPGYVSTLMAIPDDVLDQASKQIMLASQYTTYLSHRPLETYSTGLPWQLGDTWYYRTSIHDINNALDFANPCGTVGEVRAADSGVVESATSTCMLIRRGDGLRIGYQHIDPDDVGNWDVGDSVSSGQLLGNTTLAAGCGGTTGAHHVHFWLEGINPDGSQFGGWTLNDPYFIKGNISRYPNLGCVNGQNDILYEASCCGCVFANDSNFVSPALTNEPRFLNTVSGAFTPIPLFVPPKIHSVSHETGRWNRELRVNIKWEQSSRDDMFLSHFALSWTQDNGAVPENGMVELSAQAIGVTLPPLSDGEWYIHLQAVDVTGHVTKISQLGPFPIDRQPPFLQATSTETVWTGVPVLDTFHWPAAMDAGAGVAGYHVYWGEEDDSTAESLVINPAFTPNEVIIANQATTRYLRVAPVDLVGNIGEWQTVAVWHYDPTPPTGALLLNDGSDIVNSLNVILNPVAEDTGSGVTDVRFSRDGQNWSEWRPYNKQHNWKLESTAMPQTVFAQLRDAVGNVSEPMTALVKVKLGLDPPSSANYTVSCSVVGMGGGSKSSSNYTAYGTIGQPHATGNLQSSSYRVHSGFWSGCSDSLVISPTPTPTIGVTPSPTNTPLVTPTLTVTPIAAPNYYVFLPIVVRSESLP